ncbi:MAG TPA: peptide chain release factor N(5)-glutamine methyltransferase [bacterium]|nr:peptide chain release factor N(5)-glutamine methyltransferase [bacterium]HRV04239.1 peptide chain release factor N(5)-glutamine methyltransferase [Candidatus Ratteibacteria bacterium]
MKRLKLQHIKHCQRSKPSRESPKKKHSCLVALIHRAAELLSNAGISNPVFEAELFLANLLDVQRHDLYLNPHFVSKKIERKFFNIVLKRCNHFPVAYLLGNAYFYEYSFKIKPGVFIPRPETETIIDVACDLFKDKTKPLKILDICTGSGILAIVLAKIFTNSKIIAVDISEKAVNIARKNISLHKLENRVNVLRTDIFPDKNENFDFIVSNPPYLTDVEMKNIPDEVKREPFQALYGGISGMDIIKRIIDITPRILKKDGFIIMEISPHQVSYFRDTDIYGLEFFGIFKDLYGFERVVVLKK